MSEARTMEFRTELEQLLDIIIHSLYSEREIFLRELVSNASDAIDKLRFEAIAQPELSAGGSDWKIELRVDAEAKTLTVIDNGIGMTADSIVEQLGTIARSGTKEFLQALRESDAAERPELIGQFGVGFYSAFMVSDEVTVRSRHAAADKGVLWTSQGKGEFTIEEIDRAERGTEVTMHLREDASEFLEEYRLRSVVKKYSDFLEHPIMMEVERTEGEGEEATTTREEVTLNSRQALWLRPADQVTDEEHEEFYRQISHDFNPPGKTIHFAAEGTLEYKALLYIPEKRPMDFAWGEPKVGLQLYIERVFIMDKCEELLPLYLRFVKGVVDSSDLPLNVSRETLQKNRIVTQIHRGLVNKVLKELEDMKSKSREQYDGFFNEFGPTLKEGIGQDHDNRDRIAKLLLLTSTQSKGDERVDLEGYLGRMPEDQESIWYVTGERKDLLAQSPAIEALKDKGHEVLLLTDPVDEFWVTQLGEFEGKKIEAADRAALDDTEQDDEKTKEQNEQLAGLFTFMKTSIPEVKDVRASSRLRDSAAVLVAGAGSMSANLERLMKQMGRGNELPDSERILELNPEHPTVQAVHKLYTDDPSDARVEDFGRLLYEQAVLAEGSMVEDPVGMSKRINKLIQLTAEG